MSPRWRKIIRDLTSHWFRTALVVLSIAIGIFAVGVVLGGREILLREFEKDYATSVPMNVSYRAEDFGDDVVRAAGREDGMGAVQARRTMTLRYMWASSDTDRTLSVVAFEDFNEIRVEKVVPTGGAPWPPADGTVLLESASAQVGDYRVGDILEVERADGKIAELRVAGFAHDINAVPAQFVGYETGYVSFDTLDDLGEPRRYNQLLLAFDDPDISWESASRRASELRDSLFDRKGLQVYYTSVPEPGSHFLGDIFKSITLLLLALGVLALGLSAFLVVNTVSSLMAQQVRQVGIMKAVGASARQLEGLYLVAVLLYGVLAVAIGLPAASAGSRFLTDFAAGFLNFRITDYTLPPWVVIVEMAVGLVVPILAAAIPVRRGVRMSVVRALNSAAMTGAGFGHGLVDRALGLVRGLPRPVALSLRNTFLRKGRLALTLSTLVLASAVVMAVFSSQASIRQTIADLESWWRYDVQIELGTPASADAIERELIGTPGLAAIETWSTYGATVVRPDDTKNESFFIVGLDSETDFIGPTVTAGRWLKRGDTDAIVINTDAENEEASLQVGSRVTLTVLGVEKEWRVIGVIKGQMSGPTIYCPADALDAAVGDLGASRVLLRGESSDEESEQALLTAAEERLADAGFTVANARTREGLSGQLGEQLGVLVAFLLLMAALLAAVGVIGLTGTMSINVLESTREIGVMRATGAQHRSIYQIFVTEGVTIGFIAWLLGAVFAYPLSLGLVRGLEQSMGLPLTYTFSLLGVGAWLLLMLLISAMASLAPAFRASQVSVRDAIAYE